MTSFNQTPSDIRSEDTEGQLRRNGIFVGIVKDNNDAQRMGRLSVYIPDFGGDPDVRENWYVVTYAPPFAGATDVEKNKANGKEMADTQTSYGFWMVPPDLNNMVLCTFINGDPARGYWFSALYQTFMNHMVPGLALNVSTHPEINEKNLPPVCEYNKKDKQQNVWDPTRPPFEPLHNGLAKQGLYNDPERGPQTASARREAPSKVFGFLTPHGNGLSIDEDPDNEYIRLRTRSGCQVLLHETTGYIYMISKEGNSWFELSDEGINMYSKKSISIRSEGNVNFHTDQNIVGMAGGAIHQTGANITHRSTGQHQHRSDGEHRRDAPNIAEHPNPNGCPNPSSAEQEAYIRQSAAQHGVDPDFAVGMARAEGISPRVINSSSFGIWDRNGMSYGPYQLHMAPNGRALGNVFARQVGFPTSCNWKQQVDWCLAYGKQHGWHDWSSYNNQGAAGLTARGRR